MTDAARPVSTTFPDAVQPGGGRVNARLQPVPCPATRVSVLHFPTRLGVILSAAGR